MELEEAEDEEWDSGCVSEPNAKNDCNCKVRCVLNRGLRLGKQILVAGFVASAAPVVVPPLVVASAIGLAVSMPYAIFLASHACTQSLMSKLLPLYPLLREELCFQPDIETVGVQCMKNGPQEEDATDGMEGHTRGEINGDNGVVTMIKGLDNEIEEFETPFEVTTVVFEESEAMEGDIEEAELQREKIRVNMTRERGECVEGICRGANESDKKNGQVVEDMEVAWEDTHSGIIGGTEGDLRKEEDPNVCEEMLQSRNDESEDTICNEVESGEAVRGLLEGKEFDNTNESEKPMAEPSELLIPAEPFIDLQIEALAYNISVDGDSSEVITEKIDIHIVAEEEPDCPTLLQEGDLDNNISDFENQELQLRELNEMMYLSDAETIEIANESALDLFDGKRIDPYEYAYTIGLQEESSNVDGNTDSMEVLVSSVEQESGPSECSSGENIICPSQEVNVVFYENIWKQINVIRKIVGYEDTKQASCLDELKALYIFTGVEPPTSLSENSSDPTEIKEKLHFLMSLVGIKSNIA